MKNLIMILITLFFAGCSTKNIPQTYSSSDLTQKGLILFTSTKSLSDKGEKYSSLGAEEVSFFYKNTETNETGKITTKPWHALIPSSSDFEKIKGNLFVIELNPGKYLFTSWEIETRGLGGPRYISPRKMTPIPFVVQANKIFYLGEFNLDIILRNNLFGISMIFGADFSIKDSFDRDLKVIHQKYPNIDTQLIQKNILKISTQTDAKMAFQSLV